MLIGSYTGSLNKKRRIAIPKKFLSELGSRLIIAKWYENCLIIVSLEFWDKLFDRLTGGRRAISYGIRDNERFILGSAFQAEPDEQGRIVVPEILSEYAGLEKEVVFVGLRDRIEVWPKSIWDEKSGDLAKTAKEYIENLSKQENGNV
jgi:MraZ protein